MMLTKEKREAMLGATATCSKTFLNPIATLHERMLARHAFTEEVTPASVLALIDALDEAERERAALRQEVELYNKRLADFDEILNMLECSAHGRCVPGAIERIKEMKGAERQLGELHEKLEEWRNEWAEHNRR